MSSFEELHLSPGVAAALTALGWQPEDSWAREVVPTAARGHNLVVVAPPAPAYAAPALAGVLSRAAEAPVLLLAPAAQLAEWAGLSHALSAGSGLRIQTAQGTARALRRLRGEGLDLLIATPETALLLQRRSALKPELLGAVILAWPENWDSEASVTELMSDLPKESQRVVYTGAPDRATELVERYARRALTVGTPPAETAGPAPIGPVRTVGTSWSRRAAAVGELAELLDPGSMVVWAVDRSHQDAIGRAVPLDGQTATLVTGDAPQTELIVAFDPPSRERLQQLLAAAPEVVLLMPPGTEAYIGRIAAPRRPFRLPGLTETVSEAAAGRRSAIIEKLEQGVPERAILTLAPLFERHDPAAVAGALFELWTAAPGTGAGHAPAAPTANDVPAIARVFVGLGKKEGVTANDLVGVLTRELRVDRGAIGRIELRDGFSLVEVPAHDAERIAAGLSGTTIRRKRVVARVDRGPSRPAARPGGARPRGPRPPR